MVARTTPSRTLRYLSRCHREREMSPVSKLNPRDFVDVKRYRIRSLKSHGKIRNQLGLTRLPHWSGRVLFGFVQSKWLQNKLQDIFVKAECSSPSSPPPLSVEKIGEITNLVLSLKNSRDFTSFLSLDRTTKPKQLSSAVPKEREVLTMFPIWSNKNKQPGDKNTLVIMIR